MYTVVFCITVMIVDLFLMLRCYVYMCVLAVLLLVQSHCMHLKFLCNGWMMVEKTITCHHKIKKTKN
jgi:hypothetical protein